jgi:hypothetical protein
LRIALSPSSSKGRKHSDRACGQATDLYNGGIRPLRLDTLNAQCIGAPGCVSTNLPPVSVPAGKRQSTRASCPADRPNLWGWDTGQHEHIRVELVAADRRTATIAGINQANVPGDFVVSLGCSTVAYSGTQLQKSRNLAPTANLPPRQPSRAIEKRGPPTEDNPCTERNVPFCQTQQERGFFMRGWQSGYQDYSCQGEYPYVWSYTYTVEGPHGLPTSIGTIFQESPQSIEIEFTNWSVYETGIITVTLACSKSNSFGGGACGAPIHDPLCPVVPGSTKQYCSKTGPACFDIYQERCAPTNTLYNCTLIALFDFDFCQPCPG